MKRMHKIFALVLSFALLCSLPLAAHAQNSEGNILQFHNGSFKILILADLQDTDTPQKETITLMTAALDQTQPDLVVLLGDNIAGYWNGVDKEATERAVDAIAAPIDERGIPFALVFGNHDHEGLCSDEVGMTEEEAKEFLLACFQKYPTCLAIEGEELTGVCNYNLPILDSAGEKTVFNLWFMDSNPYATDEEGGGYGYVHADQTAWYQRTSDALKAENGGEAVPSLLFQHIIVPEVYDMLTETDKGTEGAKRGHSSFSDKYYVADNVYQGAMREAPCPPDVNGGQFQSWVQQGDIIGAFFGHDHVNDFAGVYEGIHLVATPACTFYSYGNHRGVRTVTLSESDLTTFQSDLLLYDELVGERVWNLYKAQHGYYEYRYRFLPIFGGVVGGLIVAAGAAAAIVHGVKKRKGKAK